MSGPETTKTSSSSLWACALIAAACCLISLLGYTPNIDAWLAFDYQVARYQPETIRAHSIKDQLAAPLALRPGPSDMIISWRQLPVLPAHYLGLPFAALVVFAWVGAFALVLTLIASCPPGSSVAGRTMVGLFVATSSTFFVSVGWLACFDAWWILALCLLAISPNRIVILCCALLAPWFDERFLIGLPAALAARYIFSFSRTRNEGLRELGIIALALSPYVVLRAAFWFDPMNNGPLEVLASRTLSRAVANNLIGGVWEALRVGWILIPGALILLIRRRPFSILVLSGTTIGSLAVSLFLAEDVSRSAGIALPVAAAAAFALLRGSVPGSGLLLAAVTIGNLTLPARHIIGDKVIPIEPATVAAGNAARWKQLRVADLGCEVAKECMDAGYLSSAMDLLVEAHAAAPGDVEVSRALAKALHGLQPKKDSLDEFLDFAASDLGPDPLFFLGKLYGDEGRTEMAVKCLATALERAKLDWRFREQTTKLLNALKESSDERAGTL